MGRCSSVPRVTFTATILSIRQNRASTNITFVVIDMKLLRFPSWVALCRREIRQKSYCKRRYDRFKEDYEVIKVFCNGVPSKRDDELFREFRHCQAAMRWYKKRLHNS